MWEPVEADIEQNVEHEMETGFRVVACRGAY